MPVKVKVKGDSGDTTAVINREQIDEERVEIRLQILECERPSMVNKVIFQECEIVMDIMQFFTLVFASSELFLSEVETLDMDSSMIGDDGLSALSNLFLSHPISFKKLSSLSLRRNNISAVGLSSLLGNLVTLQEQVPVSCIYLSQNIIRDEGALLLANLLPSLSLLRTLHVSYNQIGLQGATHLSSILEQHHLCKLESLSFMCNPYGLEGTKRLLTSLAKNRKMKALILGNTPPFCDYYVDYPNDIPLDERPPWVLKETETFATLLGDYLQQNPLLQQIVIFGLEGEEVIPCLQSGMKRNTLIESITIPSTLSPITEDLSPILSLLTPLNALEYIKCTDGFNEIETTQPGKSVETVARDVILGDCIKVLRLLPLLDKVLPDLYETILKSLLIDGFAKCDTNVLIAFLVQNRKMNFNDIIQQIQRFSAIAYLRLAYQCIEHFPTTEL